MALNVHEEEKMDEQIKSTSVLHIDSYSAECNVIMIILVVCNCGRYQQQSCQISLMVHKHRKKSKELNSSTH